MDRLSSALSARGSRNLAAWGVAAGLAYVLWVRPERAAARERAEARAAARAAAGWGDRDRAAPRADPQVGGLRKGG